MKIEISQTSNFPRYKIGPKNCIAARTRSQSREVSFFDPRTNFKVATNFFKKVVGIDRSYPNLLQMKAKNIQVNIPTVEIWTGRLSLLFVAYSAAKEHGLL